MQEHSMATSEILIRCAVGLLLLLGNAFFVCIEFALTRLRQEDPADIQGDPGLERAWKMTDELEIYLTGCQVGITIMSVGLGVAAEPALTAAIGHSGWGAGLAMGLSLGIINLLHVILGEQIPTYLGVERAAGMARVLAPIHYVWSKVIWPIIWLADATTKSLLRLFGVEMSRSWVAAEEEAIETEADAVHENSQKVTGRKSRHGGGARSQARAAMIEVLRGAGVPKDRRREVVRSYDIDEITVGSIAVPVKDVVALSTLETVQENLARIRNSYHVRYLLTGEHGEPQGVVYTPELLGHIEELSAGRMDWSEVTRPLVCVAASLSVAGLIDELQSAGQELALVQADDGSLQGIVTSTDAVETIVGEMEDPLDREGVRG